MFNKSYVKFKKFIKKNHNFILFLILFTLVLNIKVPYVIQRAGGVIRLNNQIKVNGKYIKGDYNTTYVGVNKGTVISFIMGKIIPNWKTVRISDYTSSSDMDYNDELKLQKLEMEYSHDVAIKYVFDKLNIAYEIKKEDLYVYGKIPEMENDLKYGDKIISCDGNKVMYFDDLSSCITNSLDDDVDLTIERKSKDVKLKAKLYPYVDHRVIGVQIYRDMNIKSEYNIEFLNSSSESGPSGGFMTTLALYDHFSKRNIIGSRKVAGTGTIDEEGNVGEIGGIKYKLLGAEKANVDIFFVPKDNYDEAVKIKKKHNLKIKLVMVSTLDDAINYLDIGTY